MPVTIINLQKRIQLNPARIRKITNKILKHEHAAPAALTLVFVTSRKIRACNKKFLNRDYATDVLAFEGEQEGRGERKGVCVSVHGRRIAGDIMISTDAVLVNARRFGTRPEEELVLYVIHGILHLLGCDDHRPRDTKRMRAKEKELLEVVRQDIERIRL